MRIEWYRSATVGIFSQDGTAILCDPWITDGAFIGSWYHWPPLEGFEFEAIANKKWDAIYISHFHADHFDRKLVSAIARQNPDTRILIPNYANKWLKRAILNCGFPLDHVFEIESHSRFSFKDFVITLYVADYCNPQICGVHIPCTSLPKRQTANDSLALFEADGFRVLNANDALAVHTAHRIWPLIGDVDVLLGHYGGAGPFPQCFNDITDEDKLSKALDLGWSFVDRLVETGLRLNAKYVMPYAGQYVLGGKLSSLNAFRSVIPISNVVERIHSTNSISPLTMQPFTGYNFKTDETQSPWVEPDLEALNQYINRIGNALYPYETSSEEWPESTTQIVSALESVRDEFLQQVKSGLPGSESSITLDTGRERVTINFAREEAIVSQREAFFDNHTVIFCDSRLLRRIIVRRPNYVGFTPFHFNQAEIGSHLGWTRRGPYPRETHFLNFMRYIL